MKDANPTLLTRLVGYYGQLPFVESDLKEAIAASLTSLVDEDCPAEPVWESILSVTVDGVLLSQSGWVLHHRIRAIQTRASEETVDVDALLELQELLEDYGFDKPFEID